MAPEHVVPDPPRYKACIAHQEALSPDSIAVAVKEECAQQYQELRQRVLGFLIASHWLLGEAAERGIGVSGGEVQGRLQVTSGARPADEHADEAQFAIEAEVAAALLRRHLTSGEAPITEAQAIAYYKQNVKRYETPEERNIDIVERIHSEAAARRVKSRLAPGASMSKAAIHESFTRMDPAEIVPNKRAILRAIFAAKPGVLVGPLPLNGMWCFFQVTRIVPAVVQSFASVHAAIAQQLAGERQQRRLAGLVAAWRRKWTARTDCRPGYVVQKCRQYDGPRAPEDPHAFD